MNRKEYTHYPEIIYNQKHATKLWTWRVRIYNYDGPSEVQEEHIDTCLTREEAQLAAVAWTKDCLTKYRRVKTLDDIEELK